MEWLHEPAVCGQAGVRMDAWEILLMKDLSDEIALAVDAGLVEHRLQMLLHREG